jgi:hypothetical protein
MSEPTQPMTDTPRPADGLTPEQCEDADVVNAVTAAMREADRTFEKVGGSTRHHVRDCLLPILNRSGWVVVQVAAQKHLTVVVNGKPVTVPSGPVRTVIEQAIKDGGQWGGAPLEQWELRTPDGDVIPHDASADEWALTAGKTLFLNLGLPPLQAQAGICSVADHARLSQSLATVERERDAIRRVSDLRGDILSKAMDRLVKLVGYENAGGVLDQIVKVEAEVARLREARENLLRLAFEATNGWACYAKRQIELDEIDRLHGEISASVTQDKCPRCASVETIRNAGDETLYEFGQRCLDCGHRFNLSSPKRAALSAGRPPSLSTEAGR